MTKTLSLAFTVALLASARPAAAETPAPAAGTPAAATLAEVQAALGFVPGFIKQIPETLLPGMWDQIKSFEMNPKTALDGKTKELIGLAVSSQIPCDYCIYFHTRAAKANGATDQEVLEAVGMAALTRAGSTFLNGAQIDMAQYKKDVDRIFKVKK